MHSAEFFLSEWKSRLLCNTCSEVLNTFSKVVYNKLLARDISTALFHWIEVITCL